MHGKYERLQYKHHLNCQSKHFAIKHNPQDSSGYLILTLGLITTDLILELNILKITKK